MEQAKDPGWSRQATRMDEAVALVGDKITELTIAQIDTGLRLCPVIDQPWIKVNQGKNLVDPQRATLPLSPPGATGGNPEHGTRTLSVLAGLDHPNTFQGVLPHVNVIPYRAVDDVVLNERRERDNVASAIADALDQRVSVVTISLGFPLVESFGLLGKVIDDCYEAGVIVCAAGGQYMDRFCYPGKYYRAIGVGGYTGHQDGGRSIYQSYGHEGGMNAFVDVWGPADRIWRAEGVRTLTAADAGEYGWGDGTSYATPHVAATAALWIAHHGVATLNASYPDRWMWVEAFRLLLKRSAQPLSHHAGFGRTRPAGHDEIPPGKGNDLAGGDYCSGGLDAFALINWPLPDPKELGKASRAVLQTS